MYCRQPVLSLFILYENNPVLGDSENGLNYHRLGDTLRCQQSLQDLQSLLLFEDGTRIPDQFRDISWQILGTWGDYVGAVF